MKTIPNKPITGAQPLKPAELNKIHFGGNHTPLTVEQLKKLAEESQADQNLVLHASQQESK